LSEQISPLHPPTIHPPLPTDGFIVIVAFGAGIAVAEFAFGETTGVILVGEGTAGRAVLYLVFLIFAYILKAKSTIRRQIREGISSQSLPLKSVFALRSGVVLFTETIIHNNYGAAQGEIVRISVSNLLLGRN
jgi:hypothetical protein